MRVALTGKPGVGKTTICREVAESYPGTVGGMLSGEVREEGKRIGFRVTDLSTGEQAWLARKDASELPRDAPRVGSYRVDLKGLETVGVAAVRTALQGADLVVIDEVGPMELKSKDFVETVEIALDSGTDLLMVVHKKSNHPVVQRTREESDIIEVTRKNRDDIPTRVLDLLA